MSVDSGKFAAKVRNPLEGIALFGVVPPPLRFDEAKVLCIAESQAKEIANIDCDSLIVYDIQEEKGRTEEARPFPFNPTHEPRQYAALIHQLTGKHIVLYKDVIHQDRATFDEWLRTTRTQYHIDTLVLVGGAVPKAGEDGYTALEASEVVHTTHPEFMLGGITIPERHRDKADEHDRVLLKCEKGHSFFTSQIVYNADNAICFLKDYQDACIERGKQPSRVIFAFAPFSREDTVRFLRWLGVELPHGTAKRVLSRPSPAARLDEVIEICTENFRRILNVAERDKMTIPIGFTVESVSKYRDEADAAVRLFGLLKLELDAFYAKRKERQAVVSSAPPVTLK